MLKIRPVGHHEVGVLRSLDLLGAKIERSSNFRFAWQFFEYLGVDASTAAGARAILDAMIGDRLCHHFLESSFDPMYDEQFEIGSIHHHASVLPTGGAFEKILAAAANDHLGAYSSSLRPATAAEAAKIGEIFLGLGSYVSFELHPGSEAGCDACAQSQNHLFTNWFFGVAWDWCFVVVWPESRRAWIGCLTDTD